MKLRASGPDIWSTPAPGATKWEVYKVLYWNWTIQDDNKHLYLSKYEADSMIFASPRLLATGAYIFYAAPQMAYISLCAFISTS